MHFLSHGEDQKPLATIHSDANIADRLYHSLSLTSCFLPQTNPSRGGTSRVSVMQQSQMWNERRDEWRAQAQEERLHEEMKECTFAPEIDITNRHWALLYCNL